MVTSLVYAKANRHELEIVAGINYQEVVATGGYAELETSTPSISPS